MRVCVYMFACVSDKKVCLRIMGQQDLDSVDSEAPQGASIEPPQLLTHAYARGGGWEVGGPHGGKAPPFYQHKSHQVIRPSAVIAETGGVMKQGFHQEITRPTIPYARMRPKQALNQTPKHTANTEGSHQEISSQSE